MPTCSIILSQLCLTTTAIQKYFVAMIKCYESPSNLRLAEAGRKCTLTKMYSTLFICQYNWVRRIKQWKSVIITNSAFLALELSHAHLPLAQISQNRSHIKSQPVTIYNFVRISIHVYIPRCRRRWCRKQRPYNNARNSISFSFYDYISRRYFMILWVAIIIHGGYFWTLLCAVKWISTVCRQFWRHLLFQQHPRIT